MITTPAIALLPRRLEAAEQPGTYKAFWGAETGEMFGVGKLTYLVTDVVSTGQETGSNGKTETVSIIKVMQMAGSIEKSFVAVSDPDLFTMEQPS